MTFTIALGIKFSGCESLIIISYFNEHQALTYMLLLEQFKDGAKEAEDIGGDAGSEGMAAVGAGHWRGSG